MRRHALALAILLSSSALGAAAAPAEPEEPAVGRFAAEAFVAVLTRGGENGDGAWLMRMVSLTSTEGANGVLRLWSAAGVPDEPAQGTSYVAQVAGAPDVKRTGQGAWRVRAVVFQTYEGKDGQGGTGMEVEASVVQDQKSGALLIDALGTRK